MGKLPDELERLVDSEFQIRGTHHPDLEHPQGDDLLICDGERPGEYYIASATEVEGAYIDTYYQWNPKRRYRVYGINFKPDEIYVVLIDGPFKPGKHHPNGRFYHFMMSKELLPLDKAILKVPWSDYNERVMELVNRRWKT